MKKESDKGMNLRLEDEGGMKNVRGYAPQVGCEWRRRTFLREIDEEIQRITRVVFSTSVHPEGGGGTAPQISCFD